MLQISRTKLPINRMNHIRSMSNVFHCLRFGVSSASEPSYYSYTEAVKADTLIPVFFKPLTPAFRWVYGEVHQFNTAPLSSLCGYWLKFCMERGSMLFTAFCIKGNSSRLHVNLVKRDGTFAESAPLLDSDSPTILHPFRSVFEKGFNLFDFFARNFPLFLGIFSTQSETGARVGEDVTPADSLLFDSPKDAKLSERGVPSACSLAIYRPPSHVFVAKLIRHLVRMRDSLAVEEEGDMTPSIMIAGASFGIIILVINPRQHPFGKQSPSTLVTILLFACRVLSNHRVDSPKPPLVFDADAGTLAPPCAVRFSITNPIKWRSIANVVTSHDFSVAQCSKSSNSAMNKSIEYNRNSSNKIAIECPWFDPGWSHHFIINELQDSVAKSVAKGMAI